MNKKYYPSAFILYLNFFIHGIGASILSQYKADLAIQWNCSAEQVLLVIAAMGLGRLITLPFSGPLSDKLGRRISILIGILSYAVYFVGVVYAPNMYLAYIAAIIGGAANSFLDTGVIPACVEILKPNSGLATLCTKLGISLGQLVLPYMILFVADNNMSFRTLFILMAVCIAIIGVFVVKLPLPKDEKEAGKEEGFFEKLKHAKFTPESIALILIGFTCTSTFQLWLNCNQELGKMAGMTNPQTIQTYYATGTILAVLLTAVLVKKIKQVRFLAVYPLCALFSLVAVYFVQTPLMCQVVGFLMGFFAAGGVLQLATATVNDLFPQIKGTITSIIMIASSLANYLILSLASVVSAGSGPLGVVILNIVITGLGVILAIFVNMRFNKLIEKV